jgi:ankyrin repeat protein
MKPLLPLALLAAGLLSGCGGSSSSSSSTSSSSPLDQQLWNDAANGNLPAVEADVAAGANVNYASPSDGGAPPLEPASANGHLDVVTYLVSVGGNVNQADTLRGKTPLLAASFASQDTVVDFLLTVPGIDVNHQALNLWTAAHDAAWVGDLHIVQGLVGAGADLDLLNDANQTVLQTAEQALANCFTAPATPCPATDGDSTVNEAGYEALVAYLGTAPDH